MGVAAPAEGSRIQAFRAAYPEPHSKIRNLVGFLSEGGSSGVCSPRVLNTPHYSLMLPKLP